MRVTLEKRKQFPGSQKFAEYLVRADGVVIGLVTKFHDDRWTTHPWKALGLVPRGAPITTPNPFLGNFFKADGGKQAAVAAVVAHAAKGV